MLGKAAIDRLSIRHRSGVHLDFRILGPLDVIGADGPVRLGGPRQRAVLAILLLNANRVVSIDRLADDLYGQDPPATAVTQVQRQVSDLRKLLGPAIETRSPGYLVRIEREGLDLQRFERLAHEGSSALARGEHRLAGERLREALELWRGPPLADLAYEPFAAAAVARLAELRLTAVEQRIEAELELGGHRPLIAELETLVAEHPKHERFRAQLMVALYRSGRQQDALAAYRALRRALVEDLGIEPTPELSRLEQAVLRQDPSLDRPQELPAVAARTVLVCARSHTRLTTLAGLAAPLRRSPDHELLLIELLDDERELAPAAERLAQLRASLPGTARAAAVVSRDWGGDVTRLAAGRDVGLVLADTRGDVLGEGPLPPAVAALLERSPADVALVAGRDADPDGTDVIVAFSGSEHDWAAVELGAWLAVAGDTRLRLVAPRGRPAAEGADGSRLLAAASLAVQRAVGIDAVPLLVEPGPEGLVAAAHGTRTLLVGLAPTWRRGGLGAVRRTLATDAPAPLLLVHRGPRPGGLAPAASMTRFTWSLG